jgi:AcrR family transcriptional regulator
MPRAKQRIARDERRVQLVAVAKQTFAERAYDDVAMDDLAREAGISKALLYHHFPTKRDLYVAALHDICADLIEVVRRISKDLSPFERVRFGLDRYLDYITLHQASFLSLVHSGLGGDPAVVELKESFRKSVIDALLVDSPLASADPRIALAARGWLGFVELASIEWCTSGNVARQDVRELMAHMLFESLRHVASDREPA